MEKLKTKTARVLVMCRLVVMIVAENEDGQEIVVAKDIPEDTARDIVKYMHQGFYSVWPRVEDIK